MYKVNDFFCGAGGMGLGFQDAGFEIAGAWDFDKYAVETYRHNIGDHVQLADISKLTGSDIPKADVWTFGFPCQDLSIAGRQAGMIRGETRSGLFFEVMRLLHEVDERPRIIMAENVKMLRPYLDVLRGEYSVAGYRMHTALFNSKYFGVPQNRERYFVIGVRDDIDLDFQFPTQQTDFIPRLRSVLEDKVDERYYIADHLVQKVIAEAIKRIELKNLHAVQTVDRINKKQNGRRVKPEGEEMYTLTSQDVHGILERDHTEPEVLGQVERPGHDQYNRVYGEGGVAPTLLGRACGHETKMCLPEVDVVGRTDHNGHDLIKRVYSPDGIAPSCNTGQGGGQTAKIVVDEAQRLFETTDGCAYACVSTYYKGISPSDIGNAKRTHIIEDTPRFRVRKLTPREYARLQGFPDTFEQIVSNTQFYKQMGNAVTRNVAEAIAVEINNFLQTVDSRSENLPAAVTHTPEETPNNYEYDITYTN